MDDKTKKRVLIKTLVAAKDIMEELFTNEDRDFENKELSDLFYHMNEVSYSLMQEPGVWTL